MAAFNTHASLLAFNDAEKAHGHKHLRKYRDGKGKWRYIYPTKRKGKNAGRHEIGAMADIHKILPKDDHDHHVGEAFSAGKDQGHWVVDAVDGDKVTVRHDEEPGSTKTVTRAEFKQMIHDAHSAEIHEHVQDGLERRQAVLDSAQQIGSAKHIARAAKEVHRWKSEHGIKDPEPIPVAQPTPDPNARFPIRSTNPAWAKGNVVRVNPAKFGGHEYLYVISTRKQYVREDGWSFGLQAESGYIYEAETRPATEAEAAPIKEQAKKEQAKKDATVVAKQMAEELRASGEKPAGMHNLSRGQIVMRKETAYGGGDWFVIMPDHIWHVQNNGSDGDDWSQNNVRTGGAGAIGYRVPYSKEMADKLIAANAIINPPAPGAGRSLADELRERRERREAAAKPTPVATIDKETPTPPPPPPPTPPAPVLKKENLPPAPAQKPAPTHVTTEDPISQYQRGYEGMNQAIEDLRRGRLSIEDAKRLHSEVYADLPNWSKKGKSKANGHMEAIEKAHRDGKRLIELADAHDRTIGMTVPPNPHRPDAFSVSKLDVDKLRRQLKAFASVEETRAYLGHAHYDPDTKTYVATDGHRLVTIRSDIPPESLGGVKRITGGYGIPLGGVDAATSQEVASGLYPDYTRVMVERDPSRQITLNVADIKTMADVAKKTKIASAAGKPSPLYFRVNKDGGVFQLESEEYKSGVGRALPNDTTGLRSEGTTFSVDPQYLADALRGYKGQTFALQVPKKKNDPMRIDRSDGETHIVMPMRGDDYDPGDPRLPDADYATLRKQHP